MNLTARLIVLGSTKVGDNSLVLHCISREMGRRSFITAIRKGGSRAMYLPLSILEAEVAVNSKSDLWRLKGVSAVHGLDSLRSSMDKNAISMFIAEVLYRCLLTSDEEMFDWCERSILTLNSLEGGCANFHLRFMLELCSILGFTPTAETMAPFAENRYVQLQDLLGSSIAEFLAYPLSGEARSDIARAILKYLSVHSEIPLNIRSLAVLSELYR